MKLDILKSLNAERAARRAAVVVTDQASGEQRLVKAADVARDPLKDVIEKHIRSGKSGMEETPQGKFFLTVHVPAPRIVITGAVHISQALAPIAKLLGYDVTIVDPRTAFATQERFPDVKVIAEWPDMALPPLGVDRYTAFVALTHDPKIDDPALTHALRATASISARSARRRRTRRRVERLKGAGLLRRRRSRASTRRSGSTSARCRRPRSRSRSWARSPRGCARRAKAARAGGMKFGAVPVARGGGRHCRPFHPQGRAGAQEGHRDRAARDRGAAGGRHCRHRGGAARARRRVGGRAAARHRRGGRGRGGARRPRLHRPRQPVPETCRRAGGQQDRHRRAQPDRRGRSPSRRCRPSSRWSPAR